MNLLVLNDYGISGSGTEKRIRLLLEEFLRKNYFGEIHLIESIAHPIPSKHEKIKIHQSTKKQLKELTKRIVKENNIDLIQVHNLLLLGTDFIKELKKTEKPVVYFAHDYWPFCGRRILFSNEKKVCEKVNLLDCLKCIGVGGLAVTKKNKKLINLCNLGIAPGENVKKILEENGLLKNKWSVITPWIDSKEVKEPKKKERTILFVGPMAEFKGSKVMADAMKGVVKEYPDAKLKLVGREQEKKNPLRKEIELIAKNCGIMKNIEFLGYMKENELKEEYSKASVYVCPPLWPEIFGLTWAEAMIQGCPVIGTRVGSLEEYIKGNGLLVEANNASELGEAIKRVFGEKGLAEKLSEKGKRFALKEFGVERAAKEIFSLYEKINVEDKVRRITALDYEKRARNLSANDLIKEYYSPEEATRRARLELILKEFDAKKGESILEVGCGSGAFLFHFAKKKAKCIGVDYSKPFLDFGLQILEQIGKKEKELIKLILADAKKVPLKSESFDKILAADFFEHLYKEEKKPVLKEMNRLLKRKGLVFIFTPNKTRVRMEYYIQKAINLFRGKKVLWQRVEPGAVYFDTDLHVGLINSRELRRLLEKENFKVKKILYEHYNCPVINKIFPSLSIFPSIFASNLMFIAEKT